MRIKFLVIVVVAIVTIIKDSHENLVIYPALTLVQILAQNYIITTHIKTKLQKMIVIDLVMINIIKTPPHVHYTLLALLIIQPHIVVYINLTLVLVNALLLIRIPLLDPINHHVVLLLNHSQIAIEVDLILTQGIIRILNTKLLWTLLNSQLPIFIILPEQNLNLKLLCIIQRPPHVLRV